MNYRSSWMIFTLASGTLPSAGLLSTDGEADACISERRLSLPLPLLLLLRPFLHLGEGNHLVLLSLYVTWLCSWTLLNSIPVPPYYIELPMCLPTCHHSSSYHHLPAPHCPTLRVCTRRSYSFTLSKPKSERTRKVKKPERLIGPRNFAKQRSQVTLIAPLYYNNAKGTFALDFVRLHVKLCLGPC